jgi:2,3-bisphosphoglycerate-dependent phosphoglycerate mutase
MVYTSLQTRTIETARLVMAELPVDTSEVEQRWELNERNYGDLTGRQRQEVKQRFGKRPFHVWRRSVDGLPPPLSITDPRHPCNLFAGDPRVPDEFLTGGESLRQVIGRAAAFVTADLVHSLADHCCVLVVGHGNSLRALCAVLDGLSDAEVEALNIPTGHPLLYRWDRQADRPVVPHGRYLNPAAARDAVAVLASHGGT